MKFTFGLISSLAVLSVAISAAPLEARNDPTDSASNNSVSSTLPPTPSVVDAMHGAKATASISIIGVEIPASGSSALKYAPFTIIVPAAITAAMALT